MMATVNPYDRRRDRRERSERDMMSLTAGLGFPGGGRRESPIDFADLEAMVDSAQRRGRLEVQATLPEREQDSRREAWAEGHAIGVQDGRAQLLADIEEVCGSEVHKAHNQGRELLERVGEDPRRVSKAELEQRLDATVDMLAILVGHHNAGFARDLPF